MMYQNCPIYIWSAPPDNLRGGPEVLYLLCDRLRKNGKVAKMFSLSDYAINPVFSKLYDVEMCFFKEVRVARNSVIVIPEILIQDNSLIDTLIGYARYNTLAIWYLSWDFTGVLNNTWADIIERLRNSQNSKNIYHLCESRFAYNLLTAYGVNENLFMLQHGVNGKFLNYPKQGIKQNVVFYNGFKAGTRRFVEDVLAPRMTDVEFLGLLPENGYKDKEEVCRELDRCKIYIDTCGFLGRELMPREAAVRDCILLIENYGCASVYEDYPIPSEYKLNLPLNTKSIAEKIHYNIEYYDKALLDMQVMKNKCLIENNVFETQVKNLFG